MLITSRTYSASQSADQGACPPGSERRSTFHSLTGWRTRTSSPQQIADMLLIRQAGCVRVGDVVRYTLTYNPTADTVRPTPRELYVRIRNTAAIPLRAAYLHGPYTLYASCYPSKFDPDAGADEEATGGEPQFEPYLKAGGSWSATIPVPAETNQLTEAQTAVEGECPRSVTWTIEIISQVVFSSTASVSFELLVGRDQKSVDLFSASGFSNSGHPRAAHLQDHWEIHKAGEQIVARKGVFCNAVKLLIDNTASLWNTPPFPSKEETKKAVPSCSAQAEPSASPLPPNPEENVDSRHKKRKVHIVILTHGLHSNLGADMLYLKESIDACARKAKEQRRAVRHKKMAASSSLSYSDEDSPGTDTCDSDDDDDEQVIVRGFPGNAVRTERGIQYLGKRLAKYILLMTYPDQPCLPRKNSKSKPWSTPFPWTELAEENSTGTQAAFDNPTEAQKSAEHAYQISSISFIGHSLGGLVQTYAIAYIHKHSPEFFNLIRPVNFIALATPFLGLSNENPMYVKFALDLGLVGRTGQDLGLSWSAPRVRSGWEVLIGGKGEHAKAQSYSDARSKPLLRILPCGPAHEVLAKFQRRTIYSNVVNDGIVPLRTSCLLYLDWKGLDRVEKARRDNGIVGRMAEWGWAELTGANSKSNQAVRPATLMKPDDNEERSPVTELESTDAVISQYTTAPTQSVMIRNENEVPGRPQNLNQAPDAVDVRSGGDSLPPSPYSPLSNLFSMFRPKDATNGPSAPKHSKIYKRSQTLGPSDDLTEASVISGVRHDESLTRDHLYDEYGLHAPPKTTFFESASDLLLPPLPPMEFINDPSSRPRTIFHDRVYHPCDVPPPLPPKKRAMTFAHSPAKATDERPSSADAGDWTHSFQSGNESESGLKIEEKIARAYHRNLSWRKVLVRVEPDAHNNIIVRRMFTNAYGWPVVKHLVDTHFGNASTDHRTDAPMNIAEGVESLIIDTGNDTVTGGAR